MIDVLTRDRYARAAQRFRVFRTMPPVLRSQSSSYTILVNGSSSTVYDTIGAAVRQQHAARFQQVGDGKLSHPPTP